MTIKIITTGEGGMALTNSPELAQRMARLRTHGITRDTALMTEESHGPWYYQQVELGFNYRMTDIQAALGISQLEKLDGFIARRRELAQQYDELLANLPVITPRQNPDGISAWHLYVIRLKLDKIRHSHEEVFVALRKKGVGVNLHYIPVHTQPWYQKLGFKMGQFPKTEQYYREAITIPIYPDLTETQQNKIVTALKQTLTL